MGTRNGFNKTEVNQSSGNSYTKHSYNENTAYAAKARKAFDSFSSEISNIYSTPKKSNVDKLDQEQSQLKILGVSSLEYPVFLGDVREYNNTDPENLRSNKIDFKLKYYLLLKTKRGAKYFKTDTSSRLRLTKKSLKITSDVLFNCLETVFKNLSTNARKHRKTSFIDCQLNRCQISETWIYIAFTPKTYDFELSKIVNSIKGGLLKELAIEYPQIKRLGTVFAGEAKVWSYPLSKNDILTFTEH